jgi:hypothetical protein
MKYRQQERIAKLFLFLLFLSGGLFISRAEALAATNIYRSVGPANTSNLNTSARTVTIAGSTATFSDVMPDNVGVGDVLQYQISGTYYLAFIYGRTSSTQYTVKAFDGGNPQAAVEKAVSVYRAYTSLENAESGTENTVLNDTVENFDSWTDGKDLVASDEQWNIACYDDAEDTTLGVVVSGWTTDADNYLKIYTPNSLQEVGISQRHSGVWNDNKYKLVVSDEFPEGPPLTINTASDTDSVNVWLDGLQIMNASVSGSNGLTAHNVSGETKVSNCLIKNDPAGSSTYGLEIDNLTHDGTYKLWNNIIYGFFDGGIWLRETTGSGNSLYAYNNTVVGIGSGNCFKSSITDGSFTAKNNIAQGCTDGYSGTFDSSSKNNLSDLDADAPGTNGVNSTTLTFSDASGENYHLDSSDTDAIGEGVDLSSDTYLPFSTDIDNETRSGNWDIGADERGANPTGDIDHDGDVDIFDYNLLKNNFGQSDCGNAADIDFNCRVDIFDYNILKDNFGAHI